MKWSIQLKVSSWSILNQENKYIGGKNNMCMHATYRAGSKESKQETQSERIEGTNYSATCLPEYMLVLFLW